MTDERRFEIDMMTSDPDYVMNRLDLISRYLNEIEQYSYDAQYQWNVFMNYIRYCVREINNYAKENEQLKQKLDFITSAKIEQHFECKKLKEEINKLKEEKL